MNRDSFNFVDVASNFDEHIANSIRGYRDLHDDITLLSPYFVSPQGSVLDVGCSTGNLLRCIKEYNGKSVKCVGIEPEKAFSKHHLIDDISYHYVDLLNYNDNVMYNMILSVFTMQFVSHDAKKQFLHTIYNLLKHRGGFILCEKILHKYSSIESMTRSIYYQYKQKKFTADEILHKERGLRGKLFLNTVSELTNMLYDIGFSEVEIMWKQHGFVSFLAIK